MTNSNSQPPTDREPPPLEQAVVDHYERQLQRHGPTAQGMDWKDSASQELRFDVLCSVCDLDGRSLHEVGAGAGHLVDYLAARGIDAEYSGSDLSPAMIAAARQRHPQVRFRLLDILRAPELPLADVVVCSGLFHVKLDHPDEAWREFLWSMLRRMFTMCREAMSFNLMTDQVDFRSPTLYYADPAEVLEFCRRELSRYVALRHDYPLYEYTVHVYREASSADLAPPAQSLTP